MSAITFSGLASGLDTGSIVDQLVGLAKAPINRLTTQKTTLGNKSKKLASLSTKLGELSKAAVALKTPKDAAPTKAVGSDDSVFTAAGTGGGSVGNFSVKVVSLAASDRYYANPVASRGTGGLFGSGNLRVQVGSAAAIDVAVTATDSLDTVASKINASGAGVTASVINTGSGFRLQVSGSQTGAASAVTLTETGTTFGFGATGNHPSVATDATVEIDGFTITRPTNSIENAIPGVTLTLKKPSPTGTTQSVDVARDSGSLIDKIKSFVTGYNAVSTFISAESSASVTGDAKGADSLNGDSSVRTIQSKLRTLATSSVAGTSGRYTTLGSLGISVQRTGQITLDETKLAAAMAADPDAVTKVLTGTNGVMAKFETTLEAWTNPTTGLIDARTDAISAQQRQIDDQIDRLTRRLDAYESQLRAQFTALESTMSNLQGQSSQLSAALSGLE